MKRITVLALILSLLVLPLAARATSLSDLGDKPEPVARTMPEPIIPHTPFFDNSTPGSFLGKIILPNETAGLGYEYSSFPSDPWEQTKALISYDNLLIRDGYKSPKMDQFEGENQQYLCYNADDKPSVWVLPHLKENALIVIIRYSDDILDAFPEEVSAEDAYAALVAELDSEETMEKAAKQLATIWKTSAMKQEVSGKITADNLETLLPVLIRNDYFTRYSSDSYAVNASASVTEIGQAVHDIIRAQESVEGKLSMAKKAAEVVVPVVDERYLRISSLVWDNSSDMQDENVTEKLFKIPAFDKEADIPKDLHDDGEPHKYVIVSDAGETYYLMPYHALFLPADQIAGSLAEADRIIVCHNYYQKSGGNWTGPTPSDSLTQINLYDSNDGSLICGIGFAGNYQGMISHGGIPHDWIEMGEIISEYFSGR